MKDLPFLSSQMFSDAKYQFYEISDIWVIFQRYFFNSMHAIDIQVIIVRSEGRNA